MESIKIKIEKVLIEKGIKKQDFIVKLGMSVSGYYDMIKKNTMTLATLQEISNVLEYPVEYFLPTSDNSYLVAENAKEEPGLKENYINSLVRQNEAMSKQITDLIKMQLINAETIKNLTTKEI